MRIRNAIDQDELLQLASDMIRIPSISGEEEKVARHLADWLRSREIETELQYAAPGRPNVIASIPGESSQPGLILNGHLDTGPPLRGNENPFEPRVADGYLYGLGIYNMKGAVAAMAAALSALRRTGGRPERHVTLTAVVGEGDLFGLGTKEALRNGPRAAGAICSEPTGSRIRLRHMGLVQFRISIEGRAAHQKERSRGVDAISAATTLLGFLDESELTFEEHRIDGAPQLLVGQIAGGTWPMVTAPDCVLTGDVRIVEGMTADSVKSDIESMIQRARAEFPELDAHVEIFVFSSPFEVRRDEPLIETVARRHREVFGSMVEFIESRHLGVTDSSHFHAAGVPTALYGPGEFSMLEPDRISIQEMNMSAEVFFGAASDFCGFPTTSGSSI